MYGVKAKTGGGKNRSSKKYKLFFMVFPLLILLFLFSYLPLYGWVYAFFDYRPPKKLADCAFVGLNWFQGMVLSLIHI